LVDKLKYPSYKTSYFAVIPRRTKPRVVREFPQKFRGIVNNFLLTLLNSLKEYLTYTYIAQSGRWPCWASGEILIVERIDDWGVKGTRNHWPSSYRGRSGGSPQQKGIPAYHRM
jgi:hypothetical protein